jgi:predicted Fe-Mo cluster-binding NifX family protein
MIERKAFFISGSKLTSIAHEKETLVIFDMNNDSVVGVETVNIKNEYDSTEALLLFLQRRHIRVVYVSEMDSETKSKFSNSGIMVKTLLTLTDDWLFNSLYLLPPVF